VAATAIVVAAAAEFRSKALFLANRMK